jgi:hypothetical protein
MKRRIFSGGVIACLVLTCGPTRGEETAPTPAASAPTQPDSAVQPAQLIRVPTLPSLPELLRVLPEVLAAAPPPAPEEELLEPPALASNINEFLGDQGPIGILTSPPGGPPTGAGPIPGAILVPSLRGFKIADNGSPVPRDRIFFSFNYYDNVNAAANRLHDADLHNVQFYRETLGLEKACLGGAGSLELRLPVNTLSADSTIPGLGGTNTAVGDLTGILKYAFIRDPAGTWASSGLAVTTPTGPNSFAGSSQIVNLHSTRLQPFLGYYCARGALYVQGFSALDVPTDSRDVTILYNDLGVGYFCYQSAAPGAVLTGVAPTLEVHLNDPLNHRGVLRFADPAGTPDVVDLTAGTNFVFCRRARLAIGVVTPLTGPKPFDVEAIGQFRLLY